jgi:hypothetical protein
LLYEDNVFFPRQPEYGAQANEFHNYLFVDTQKVNVGTQFFVGWRQFDAERLNVGLDRNLDNSQYTYYSVNGGASWNQSIIDGSVMIRPIFSTALDAELGLPNIANVPVKSVRVYPNPVLSELYVQVEQIDYTGMELISLEGKILMTERDKTYLDLSDLPSGYYFLNVYGFDELFKIVKY